MLDFKDKLTPIINSIKEDGELRKKIDFLNITFKNYQENLKEIRNVLLSNLNTILELYKKFRKSINSSIKDEDIEKDFNEFSTLSNLNTSLKTKNYLDLSREIEEFPDNETIAISTIWNPDLKFEIQFFNLIMKRQLQTIVIAEAVEKSDLLTEKIKDSFKKYKSLINERKKTFKLSDVNLSSGSPLQAGLEKVKNILAKIEEKKHTIGATFFNKVDDTKNNTEFEDLKTKIVFLEKLQNGFSNNESLNENLEFLRPGYLKTIEKLKIQAKNTAELKTESIFDLNDLYK